MFSLLFTTLLIISIIISSCTFVINSVAGDQQQHYHYRDLRTDPSLRKALSLQFQMETLDIEKQQERIKLEERYRTFISKAVFERNLFLRKVPAFWYYALRSTPNSHLFMSPIHHHSHFHRDHDDGSTSSTSTSTSPLLYCGVGGSDQCVANDHDFLKSFLRNVRCYRVSPTPETTDSRGWTSHQQQVKKQVSVSGLGEKLPADAIPHHNTGDGSAELRVELEFESNSIFQERKIFRQVPLQYKNEMLVADEVEGDDRSDKAKVSSRAYFGLGTTLKWKGSRQGRRVLLGLHQDDDDNKNKNNKNFSASSVSFFSLFDEETLAAASTRPELAGFKKVLQHGLSALVNSVCNQLDHNPIPFYDREHGEEDLAQFLELQQHSRVMKPHLGGKKKKKNSNKNNNNQQQHEHKPEHGIEVEITMEDRNEKSDNDDDDNVDGQQQNYYGMMTEEEKELVRVLKGDL